MSHPRPHRLARFAAPLSLAIALACHPAAAEVVISQVYGGGGNSGATLTHDYIELFNNGSSAVDVSGWSVQYAAASGTTWQRTALSGTIAAGGYYLVQQAKGSGGSVALPTPDAIGTVAMSGSAGKVALVRSSTPLSGACPSGDAALADIVGFGSANCAWVAPTPSLSNATAAVRKDHGCSDQRNNSLDFAVAAPAPRHSASATHSCTPVALPTNPSLEAAASPTSVLAGESTLLTLAVTPGTNPTSSELLAIADLSALGGLPGQPMYDDGSHGDAVAGDLRFSLRATVPASLAGGRKTIGFAVRDAQQREASASAALDVVQLVAIHAIQGAGERSPLLGQSVVTEGIVTGVKSNGFYIQAADAEQDGDAASSEGVFVFTNRAGIPAGVALGNRVRVQATVVEYTAAAGQLPLTELTNPQVSLLASGQPLPAPVLLDLQVAGPQSARDALERYEGMRVAAERIDVVAPTLGNINERTAVSSGNGVFYGVLGGVPRPLREPGVAPTDLLAVPANTPRFDGNPELLRIDSKALGAPALTVDAGAVLHGVRGVLDYAFGAYSLLPDAQGIQQVVAGPAPRPARQAGYEDISVAGFNLLRFFDDHNDPAIGEPVLTADAYAFRLAKTAAAICDYLHAPDILGVVEVESLSVLARLADEINRDCPRAPQYQALLEEGNDVGGIDVGFLVSRREVAPGLPRVEIEAVEQIGGDTQWTQPDGSAAILNDRPSLVLQATVNQDNGHGFALTVLSNHLRSLSGANETGSNGERVRAKRAAQARFLAEWLEARQQANPDERLVLVGDFNAFEFSDGLVDVMGVITGAAAAADQVLLHVPSPVSRPLRNLTLDEPANQRYSFSFDGNAQTLDHLLVNQALLADVAVHVDHARLNADFSEARFGDAGSDARVSDHDPVLATLTVPGFRTADLGVTLQAQRDEIAVGHATGFVAEVSNAGPSVAPAALRFSVPAAAMPLQVIGAAGWQCGQPSVGGDQASVDCQHAGFAPGNAQFQLQALGSDALGGSALTVQAQLSSEVADPALANNQATASTRVLASADLVLTLSAPRTPIITGRGAEFALALRNAGPDAAWSPLLQIEANAPASALSVVAPAGWQCQTVADSADASRIDCRYPGRFVDAASAALTLRANPPRNFPRSELVLQARVLSSTPERNPADNAARAAQRIVGVPGFGG